MKIYHKIMGDKTKKINQELVSSEIKDMLPLINDNEALIVIASNYNENVNPYIVGIGWVVFTKKNPKGLGFSGWAPEPEGKKSRNIASAFKAMKTVIKWAKEHNLNYLHIYYKDDLIKNLDEKQWTPSKKISKRYTSFMHSPEVKSIRKEYVKTNDNRVATNLAKKALGLKDESERLF